MTVTFGLHFSDGAKSRETGGDGAVFGSHCAVRARSVGSCDDREVVDEPTVRERRGGIGRSDAVRLPARGTLRRVNAQWEKVVVTSIFGCGSHASGNTANPVWLWGETNPRRAEG